MNNTSIKGFKHGEFEHLAVKDKKKLLKLMARIMERAYRRGVQQALFMYEKHLIDKKLICAFGLHAWRYNISLDKSVGIDKFTTSSLERLFIEEPLDEIGFDKLT